MYTLIARPVDHDAPDDDDDDDDDDDAPDDDDDVDNPDLCTHLLPAPSTIMIIIITMMLTLVRMI